ncbi:MAG TPA: hypothetical protein VH019_07030 [Rhizomicrobium sp.]|nr:hypothetical protein [Rhizomicrobium sp.]
MSGYPPRPAMRRNDAIAKFPHVSLTVWLLAAPVMAFFAITTVQGLLGR